MFVKLLESFVASEKTWDDRGVQNLSCCVFDVSCDQVVPKTH